METIEDARQIYTRGMAIIVEPARWTRGNEARTRWGTAVDYSAVDAYQFTALGALRRAGHELDIDSRPAAKWMHFILTDPIRGNHAIWLENWNDNGKHSQIRAGFRAALGSLDDGQAARHPIFTGGPISWRH